MGLATYGFDFMLQAGGGTIRRVLTEAVDVVACYSLHEIGGSQARNIAYDSNHGTYSGSLARGQTIDIPEGQLGLALQGGWAQIPDDSALGLTLNLSLAAGGFNIYGFIQTSTNDATNRCLVQKQVTNSTGNGYHVSLVSGALEFYLKVGGSVVFNFTRGSVADGNLHFFDCCHAPDVGTGEAYIFIDGVQSGATVTGVSTEAAPTTANVRIGAFNDGAGTHTNTIVSLITLSRRGDTTLSPIVQAMRSWDDASADLRAGGFRLQYGIPGTSPTDRVASTGALQGVLDNRGNGGGKYSVAHPNVTTGFDLGIPVRGRISYSSYSKVFRGYLKSATPTAGINRTQDCQITAVDYMNVLAETRVTRVPAQQNIASWVAWGLIVDEARKQPAAVDLTLNTPTFPFAFDNSRAESMRAMSELQRIHQSDFGWTFVSCQSPGGVLTLQDREEIQAKLVSATFDSSMHDFEFTHDLDSMINTAQVTVRPRPAPVGGTKVLYQAGSTITIPPNTTARLAGAYRDPDNTSRRVGSITITPPVPTTDYIVLDDIGDVITSFMIVTVALGGNVIDVSIQNPNEGVTAFVTFFRVRGEVSYPDATDRVIYEDGDSVKQYGPREFQFEMPFQDEIDVGTEAAQFVVGTRSGPTVAARMRFVADTSPTLMQHALQREPGDVIAVRETMTSGATYHNYYIMHIDLSADESGFLTCEWLLAPVTQTERFWVLGLSQLGLDTALSWGV